jgi:formylglycine-generating enzyme required for sulfatase activity
MFSYFHKISYLIGLLVVFTSFKLPEDIEITAEEIKILRQLDNNMKFVAGGDFWMGCDKKNHEVCKEDELPLHKVHVDGFYIGRFEITQKEWKVIMKNNPSKNQSNENNPVESFNLVQLVEFIKKLNYVTGKNFSLPTEAEWEYAARGGIKALNTKYSGSNDIDKVAWFQENSDTNTHIVGLKKPNELGLYDMSGNVWEWCSDFYSDNYYQKSDYQNPKGPKNALLKVVRGGSYKYSSNHCLVNYRTFNNNQVYLNDCGVRLVRKTIE